MEIKNKEPMACCCIGPQGDEELCPCELRRLKQMDSLTHRLAIALSALVDVQNGSPLIKYEEEWNDAMTMADKVLEEYRNAVKEGK